MSTAPGHGKELMAAHERVPKAPRPRTFKPLVAAVLILGTAAGGFVYAGGLIAAPLSPWVTGDSSEMTGHVKDNATPSHPLANATVAVGSRLATTNDTGYFEISGVPSGRQVIVVDSAGYRQLRFITIVSGGSVTPYSFVLTPGNGTRTESDVSDWVNFFYTCGGITAVMSSLALLGGLFAAQRKRFSVATAGGIIGMGIVPLIPFSTLFCLGAIVVLLFSRSEFQ
jgi:hypothetical protein